MKKQEVREGEEVEEEVEEEARSPTAILSTTVVKRKQSSLKSLSGPHCLLASIHPSIHPAFTIILKQDLITN